MLIVLLGPPGAGKGTQAELLVAKYQLIHIATGDILRSAIKKGSPLGIKAREHMDQGQLVPDEIVVGMVSERLRETGEEAGALLDGFPRTLMQAQSLSEMLEQMEAKIDRVIFIEVPEEELITRLTGRRVCRECGSSYHLKFNQPKVRNVCDQCGGELYQRDDDSLQTVTERLEVFNQQTAPVVEYYRQLDIMTAVNGDTEISQVFNQIVSALDKL
ncbi:MAG TPA: adenylate kinase [Firmicutes bacterium]|nr:adenylate kinase [Bacillota bacterium]